MVLNKKRKVPIKILVIVGIIVLSIGLLGFKKQDYNVKVVFRPMVRAVESRLVGYKTQGYDFVTTENFIIRYEENIDLEIVKMIARTAEDKYRAAVEVFEYKPKEKIQVILYDNPEVLMQTTMLKKGSPPMGVYYGDTIHILNPIHWVKNVEKVEEYFYSQGPFLHELVHLFTDHIAKGNFPIWFTEGVSLYFEYKVDGYEWGKEVVFQENEYTLEELTDNFHGLNEYLAYTQSFRNVKNFVDDHGIDALMDIIKVLGEGKSLQEFIHLF
ncbi:Peptidase MA superfamily protein [Natronincola peptidivorans]|uniref:Peptidase MA superfamily protein n=1 Tax=Natronincola peptidivorans TaxID=426128 RepID=A0A1I0B562_9FIRM|nr:peptidase MA family metallohydrolase [Natronincola peptidivorans]SET01519.1 Peptidase MA superfamily protein [Natronincola peptidivorans]